MEKKMALGADAANVMLLGANTWSCSPGICFLPRWVMDSLGVLDGDQVEIEPLQPPLNEEGQGVSRSLEPCKIQAGRWALLGVHPWTREAQPVTYCCLMTGGAGSGSETS
jgi:hypothetical protein